MAVQMIGGLPQRLPPDSLSLRRAGLVDFKARRRATRQSQRFTSGDDDGGLQALDEADERARLRMRLSVAAIDQQEASVQGRFAFAQPRQRFAFGGARR